MQRAIKEFCQNEAVPTGMLLIDMPTGSGKTHQSLNYLFDAVMDPSNKGKKYFFITSVKNNLPFDKLKERFESAGLLDQFYQKVLFIDSNMDSVVNNFSPSIKKAIPDDIKEDPRCIHFVKELEYIKAEKSRKADPSVRVLIESLLANAEKEFREKTEPAFHKLIQNKLYNAFSDSPQARLTAIKTDKNWKWVGELYPTAFTAERQIYFLSMDKFLSGNITLIESPYAIYTSEIVKDAVIIIDEFDATKETILKNIIRSNLATNVEYLTLFRTLHAFLQPQTGKFPVQLTTNYSPQNQNQSLQKYIDFLKDKADQLYDDFAFEYEFRTLLETGNESNNFMFQDFSFYSVLGAKSSFVTYEKSSMYQQNLIKFSNEAPENRENNIQNLLGALNGYITYFQNGIAILAQNYKKRKEALQSESNEEFSIESAIRTVLSLFHLSSNYEDFLTQQILLSPYSRSKRDKSADYDLKFYEQGFRYYSFENSDRHDLLSKIMVSSFDNTPEKILVHLCNEAKVIGISATATVESVIGNYDLEYIESKLGSAFVKLSKSERTRLEHNFQKSIKGYKDINIKVNLLGDKDSDSYSKESWNRVFQDPEFSCYVFDRIECELPSDDDKYHKERYLRIALAYKEFLSHNDVRSFLCVLTKHPKPDDQLLNLNVLYEIFGFIGEENAPYFNTRNSVYLLDSAGFTDKKNDLTTRLGHGEKLFVISVYQTIGAGQNLQYPIPVDISDNLISINEWPSRGEKDFDAIYLDKPTNLLVNLHDNLDNEEFSRYLYYTQYLQENGEITIEEARQYIAAAFRCRNSQKKQSVYTTKNKPNESRSVISYCTRLVIQAIGRICRTNQKNKTIYIYADSRISDYIDLSVCEGRALNPEFLALLDAVKDCARPVPIDNSLEAKAAKVSMQVNKEILKMIKGKWYDTSMEKWKTLRRLALSSPTLSKEAVASNFAARNFFVRLPKKNDRLYYSQDNDYSLIKVSFEKNNEFPLAVSSAAAKLDSFMSVPMLKQLFEENGWATEFIPNDYILSPTYFNNIYKGALGEEIGKFLFKEFLQVELEEITDPLLFEKFDFKFPGEPIYVDFKNWHESAHWTDDEILPHIEEKAVDCNCRCVFIVNILAEDKWRIRIKNLGDIKVVVIPSLLLEGDPIKINEKALSEIRRCINECSSI